MQNQERVPEDALSEIAGGAAVADYITIAYPTTEIRAAGKALAGSLPYTEEAVHHFRVAHNFRMAHAYPLTRERIRLAQIAGDDCDTSGRLKRMASIRKKLAASGLHLDKVQDLAGVRAIASDMSEVRRIVATYEARHSAQIAKAPTDYVVKPKETGYRSIHIIKTYAGAAADYVGMKVEIQVRTRLQHVWAAAQETVGMLTGDDLKGGKGDPAWRRLMVLMSGFIAELEGEFAGDRLTRADRTAEIAAISERLQAVAMLSGVRSLADSAYLQRLGAGFFLLSLNVAEAQINVRHVHPFAQGAEDYFRAAEGGEGLQSLMVTVDDATALLRTYPSYFLDMTEFIALLRDASVGRYRIGSRTKVAPLDLSFLSGGAWRGRRN